MQKRILVRREAASIAAIDAACCGGCLQQRAAGIDSAAASTACVGRSAAATERADQWLRGVLRYGEPHSECVPHRPGLLAARGCCRVAPDVAGDGATLLLPDQRHSAPQRAAYLQRERRGQQLPAALRDHS